MRELFRSNLFRVAILLWFAGWLVVVMPGHTRGVVKLPGAALAEAASCCEPAPAEASCCAAERATTCCGDVSGGAPKPGDAPIDDPAKHCAICFLKATLTEPPPVTCCTPFLGELDELAYCVESSIADAVAAPAQLRGRAPPA